MQFFYDLFLYLKTLQLYIEDVHSYNPDIILDLFVEGDHECLSLRIRLFIGGVMVVCRLIRTLKYGPTASYNTSLKPKLSRSFALESFALELKLPYSYIHDFQIRIVNSHHEWSIYNMLV